MKLNHECVRDLLLAIESLPKGTVWYSLPYLMENTDLKSKSYSIEEIAYTATCLNEANFIISDLEYMDINSYRVQKLTWEGHGFLDNIRDNKVWKTIKEKSSIFKSVSISVLNDLGLKIVNKMLGTE